MSTIVKVYCQINKRTSSVDNSIPIQIFYYLFEDMETLPRVAFFEV